MANISISRDRRHEAIRTAGFGEKLDRLITMLEGYRTTFTEVVKLEANAPDRIAAQILGQLALRARAGLRAIESTLDDPQLSGSPYGSLGSWGPNGRGPQVADLLRSARFHAKVEG